MSRNSLAAVISPVPLLLLAAALLSWAYIATLEPHGMDVGVLLQPRVVAEGPHQMSSEMPGMDMGDADGPVTGSDDGMGMPADVHGAMPITIFLTGWVVMMAAMMLPAVVPVVMVVARWSRSQRQPPLRLVAFVAGYLLVWSMAGLLYYLLIEVLARSIPASEAGVRSAAAILFIAGIYQFSPLKDRCLSACRAPLGFLMTHGGRMARGTLGYVDVGARHGLYCLGCCWMLMVVLVLLGVMNILWMLVVAAVIFIEKATRFGPVLAKVSGVAVVGSAAALLIAPTVIV
ncbi:MAG: DUF2182 domain-containing protein [Actinomycetota bacterium]